MNKVQKAWIREGSVKKNGKPEVTGAIIELGVSS